MALEELIKAVRSAKRIYLCGNGGSAANAIHIANDLVSCGIRAIPLTGDVATLTAIANDYGYEHCFERQVLTHGEPEDLLIVLSGSGNSVNILLALEAAREIGMDTWAVVGEKGGAAPQHAKNTLRIGANMQEAEEAQVRLGHELLRALR